MCSLPAPARHAAEHDPARRLAGTMRCARLGGSSVASELARIASTLERARATAGGADHRRVDAPLSPMYSSVRRRHVTVERGRQGERQHGVDAGQHQQRAR